MAKAGIWESNEHAVVLGRVVSVTKHHDQCVDIDFECGKTLTLYGDEAVSFLTALRAFHDAPEATP